MNERHLTYLASPEWAESLRTDVLPWLETVADLSGDVLEIGPGPGLTTDLLRARANKVTAVEIDTDLATALAERLADTNVEVISGDAITVGLPADRFSTTACLSMLHHLPSPRAQDQLFAEVCRALRPGGTLVGIDSLDTERIRQGHLDDTFVPLDLATLRPRLEAAGFTAVTVDEGEYFDRGDQIRFHARKPG